MSSVAQAEAAMEKAVQRRMGGDVGYGVGDPVPDYRVIFALELTDGSGIAERIAEGRDEDRQRAGKGPGGRPVEVSDRAIVALLLVLAMEHSSLLVSEAAVMVAKRLSPEAKELLGLDQRPRTRKQWYWPLWRAFHRVLDVIDPFPITSELGGDRRARMTKAQHEQIIANRNPEDARRKQDRLDLICNQLLEATFQVLPRHIRRRYEGNVCVDATVVAAFGQRAPKRESKWAASDPDAAWYTHEGDHRDGYDEAGKRRKRSWWGWESHLLVMAPNNDEPRPQFPLLILAASFDKPGHRIAENAMTALRSVHWRGHPAGRLAADRAYLSNSKVEKLQLPMRALGYEAVNDYRTDQLGVKAGYAGAVQVEGTWYGPCLPEHLVNATIDFRNGVIDEDTWQQRLEQRRRYALRPKERPDADGRVRLMCPAVGPSATAACPLKPTRDKAGKTPITAVPENPGPICTNLVSVTFPVEAGAKYGQALPYGTPEWQEAYSRPRNTIEGFNGYVKDPNREGLADPLRRRVRGYTAAFLFTTILVMSANLRKIDAFLTRTEEERNRPKPPRAKKQPTVSLKDYLPEPIAPAAHGPPAAA